MKFRQAEKEDAVAIMSLLRQVNNVHHEGRPDLFQKDKTKYTAEELEEIIEDKTERPIYVATDDDGRLAGYCFCVVETYDGKDNMVKRRTLYIDDLCVDEKRRGRGVGRALYEYVVGVAKKEEYHNITLNVWECNPEAMGFYRKMGLTPYKTGMEKIL